MIKKGFILFFSSLFFLVISCSAFANNVKIAGVEFPTERIINGKKVYLNGVSVLKKFGFLSVYATGLYLENPTNDPEQIIYSEEIKCLHTKYLTDKATEVKIREGFLNFITRSNSEKLLKENKIYIDKFVSWLDADMGPGFTSETIYIPDEGLTLTYKNEIKGTIDAKSFAQMYYRYNVGDNSDENIRKGLLGLINKTW